MAIPHAAPGDLIALRPRSAQVGPDDSEILIRTHHLEVFRYVLPAGKETVEHTAAGVMVVQCLEGSVEVRTRSLTRTMNAGTMLYLEDAQPHSVRASTDCILIVTVLLHRE